MEFFLRPSILIFFGGGFGALLRWGIGVSFFKMTDKIWPGTLVANLLGTFLIFLFFRLGLFETKVIDALVKIGFLGALTTFSTFAFEVVYLYRSGQMWEGALVATLNILAGIIIGILIIR